MELRNQILKTLNECEFYFKQLKETEKNQILIDIPTVVSENQQQQFKEIKVQNTLTNLQIEIPQKSSQTSVISELSNYSTLSEFDNAINQCTKCELCKSRNKFVFGAGNPNADLMLVGEAPGADEDKIGVPFVGRSGKLLDKILGAIEIKREDVFVANILKCRPPDNRDPMASEVEKCEPYLKRQIELINPKIILALGRIAAQTLLRTKDSLTKLRQKEHNYHGKILMVTYHPAALLRNPNWKRPTWEDVQKVKKIYVGLR